MSQAKLKEYQKKLFEYDYTLKKIDTILLSKLSSEEREQYKLNREACQRVKTKCSQEMADYARQNRLSLLVPPLSKEEKEDLIRSIEEGPKPGQSEKAIRFDDIREIESEPELEKSSFKTKHLSEVLGDKEDEVENDIVEDNIVESDIVESDIVEDDVPEYRSEVIQFIRDLREGLVLFYGE
ncbi:MAG TPA: hypothetical protein PL110_00160 [Candidatus Eremiobacteraeota bacterium]|nr:MAG: hypothetical protein BWY64_00075 [bacterium ADurb.Bin363]HPZ06498.1 hypothetical protein [Candidatus Eremiobacteraeota bacterium]